MSKIIWIQTHNDMPTTFHSEMPFSDGWGKDEGSYIRLEITKWYQDTFRATAGIYLKKTLHSNLVQNLVEIESTLTIEFPCGVLLSRTKIIKSLRLL